MAAVDLVAAAVSTAVVVVLAAASTAAGWAWVAEASAAVEWEWVVAASVPPQSAVASVQPHCPQRDFAAAPLWGAAPLSGTASAAPASTTDSGTGDFRSWRPSG